MKKKWYVAILIVRCRVGVDSVGPWTCDEQIRVIRASNEDDAYVHALQIGKDEEVSYKNNEDETVYWEFVGLADLQELLSSSIRDGTEITSRRVTTIDPASLVLDKDRLEVYWSKYNRHRKASEILED